MRPIDDFTYVSNQALVPDQASLMRCYYPILGHVAYTVYQYLMAFYDNGMHRHKFADILNHTGFGMKPVEEALAVLTAVDLLAFYQSPSGYYVFALKSPLPVSDFLDHAVYRSLLEQKIGEPALDALRTPATDGLKDLSKRFSEVYQQAKVSTEKVSASKPKNNFDVTSFRNRMQADGLSFTDEKADIPELFSLSERYGMTWYDTYLLAKETAVQNRIMVKRMQVRLDQSKTKGQEDAFVLTPQEQSVLKLVKTGRPLTFLQSYKARYQAEVTAGERTLLEQLAKRNFLDEVINLIVVYSLNQTHSVNLNKTYVTKIANDFAYKQITTAEQGLLALRTGYERKKQTTTSKSSKDRESNVPKWSNPNYDNQTSQADQAKLDEIKRRALAKLADQGKE